MMEQILHLPYLYKDEPVEDFIGRVVRLNKMSDIYKKELLSYANQYKIITTNDGRLYRIIWNFLQAHTQFRQHSMVKVPEEVVEKNRKKTNKFLNKIFG